MEPDRGISYGIVQPGGTVADGVPVIRVSDVRDSRIKVDAPLRVSKQVEAAYSRTRLRGGELLVTIVGTVGETAIVPAFLAGWNVARAIAVLPIKPEVGARWVKWALLSPAASAQIQSRLNTTVQATLNLGDLAKLPILLPPPSEREKIGALLGALDDKIDLNRRINDTLEAIGRAIFKDWFVDFGPTRAKMEGRAPYLAPEYWKLFPDQLDDEGKPEGWERRPYGALLEDSVGGDWGRDTSDEEHDQAVNIIRGTDMPNLANSGIGKVPTRYTTAKRAASRTLRDLDLVVEVSGGSPTQPTGRSLLVTSSILSRFSNPVLCASFCRRFRPKSIAEGFLAAQHLSYLYSIGGTWDYQNQSTGIANFQTSRFLEKELIFWPGDQLAECFAEQVEPLIRASTRNESLILSATRDLLLPKLMSGEVHVEAADKVAQGAH